MRWHRNPGVLWRSTSAGPVLLAPDAPAPERIAGLGAVVWELVDEPMTLTAIEAAIADEAEPPAAGAVAASLEQLRDLGLIEPAP